jgi:hypothetical protein
LTSSARFPLASSVVLLGMFGCQDQVLAPVEVGSEDSSPDTLDTLDSGAPDSADTGEPVETGHATSCGETRLLGPEDGRRLVRSEEVVPEDADSSVSEFGYAVGVGVLEGAPALWVQTGLPCSGSGCPGHREEWGGAYLLPGSAWEDTVLPSDARPNVSVPAGAESGAMLVRGGLTLGGDTEAGAAFRGTDEPDENTLYLFAAAPMAGSEEPEADVRFDHVNNAMGATFGDFDGDGLDDVVLPARTTTIHLSPLASGVRDASADADVTLSMSLASADLAVADLDGDGIADLAAESSETTPDGQVAVLLFMRGPVTSDRAGDPDGTLENDVGVEDEGSHGVSGGSLVEVGDLTGDSRPDLAWVTVNPETGETVVFVVDQLPAGSMPLSGLATRLVVPPAEDTSVRATPTYGVAVHPGDLTGDGFADLVLPSGYSNAGSSPELRTYVVPGPVEGEVDMADGAIEVRLPGLDRADWQVGSIVPDVDGDGVDDLLLGVANTDPNTVHAGTAWLFSGCEDW